MKKTLKLFGLAALVAIAFSCTKKDDPFIPGTPTDQTTPNEGQTEEPAVIPATDGGVLTSFGATVDSEATKVTVDLSDGETKGKTTIKDGDEVRVVDSEGHSSAIYVYDESQSKFVLKKGETAVTVKTTGVTGVYYPESEYDVMKDGTVQLALPAGIADDGDDDVADFGAAFGAINPMAGVITGDKTNGYSVTLNNIVSALRVKVSAEVNINSVTLDFGSDNKYAGAKFTVDPSTFTDPSTFADPSTSALTYVEGSGSASYESVELDTPALTADVLFLLPTVEQTYGITVTANLAGNHNGGTDSFSLSNAAYTPTAGKLSTMSFYAGLFSGGTGTMKDPYKIANARDFKHISVYCANGYTPGGEDKDAASFLGAYYQQTANIDFKGANLSAYMIGGASTPFIGTYNGKPESTQYTLSNFIISGSPSGNEGVAPFKAINSGAVLQNISISGATVTGGKFTAGLVGYANGLFGLTIQNCSISSSTISASGDYGAAGLIGGLYAGTVSSCSGTDLTIGATNTSGNKRYYGGLISYARGNTTVSGCSLNGTTTVNGTPAYFGGIVGQVNEDPTTVTGCHNHSSISGVGNFAGGIVGLKNVGSLQGCTNDGSISGAQYVGGIVAKNAGGSVIDCTNTGKGTITSTGDAGGIAGQVTGGTIKDCTNESSATFSVSGATVGGIAGTLIGGTITGCENHSDISGAGNFAGGIAGDVTGGTIKDCTNESSATFSVSGATVGGIAGNLTGGTITGCENHSDISGAGNFAGGIVGIKTNGSIEGCTNDGSVGGAQYVGGIAGSNAAGNILGCTNTDKGTITSTGDAGGIAGQVTGGTIQTCKNSGNVNASGNNVGGIAGSQSGGSEILECWSNAQITGMYQTGGIVGFLDDYGAVVRCTAKGDVSGTQCVGGIVGHAYASNTENARGILVMECLSKANVTASTGTNSNSGGVIGRLHSNRVSGGSIQWANVFQCVGWSATIKNTNTDACTRFGAFVGFLNTEYSSAASTQARCQVRNSYTTVATEQMKWLAGKPSSTGGFVGQLQRGRFHRCYYQLDNNTQSATVKKNVVTLEYFTKVDNDFATYLMSNLETTADDNYTGNGKSYPASAWTMTGCESEPLDYPLPSALVALGTEYYD